MHLKVYQNTFRPPPPKKIKEKNRNISLSFTYDFAMNSSSMEGGGSAWKVIEGWVGNELNQAEHEPGRGCADCYGNPASGIRIMMRVTV